jgi:hypothetical protein
LFDRPKPKRGLKRQWKKKNKIIPEVVLINCPPEDEHRVAGNM